MVALAAASGTRSEHLADAGAATGQRAADLWRFGQHVVDRTGQRRCWNTVQDTVRLELVLPDRVLLSSAWGHPRLVIAAETGQSPIQRMGSSMGGTS